MRYDREFGCHRSPFASPWWPGLAARLRNLGIDPDPTKAGRNFDNGAGSR
jgi:hypothetical protein